MPEITYADGSILIGNELSPDNVVQILQPIVCSLLGINPPDYNLVRVEWPEKGQPAWKITDDVAFIRCVDDNGEYSQQRDDQTKTINGATIEEITYVTTWRAYFDFYGPNCYLRASNLISGMLLQVGQAQLAAAGLYIWSKAERPIYSKENRNGQWWPRASFSARFNYQVTDRITVPTALSAEILLFDPAGEKADINVVNPTAPPNWPSAS